MKSEKNDGDNPNVRHLSARNRRIAYSLLHLITLCLFCALAGWFYFERFAPQYESVPLNWHYFLLSVVTAGAGFFAQSFVFAQIARSYSVRLGLLESYWLALANGFLNYLPAKAGLFARGGYLKVVYDMAITTYAVLLARTQGLLLLAAGFIGIVVLYGAWPRYGESSTISLLAGALSAMMLLGVAAFLPSFYSQLVWLLPTRLHRFLRLPIQSKGQVGLLSAGRLGTAAVAVTMIGGFRLLLVSESIGVALGPTAALVMQSAMMAGTVISLMPANVGIREGLLIGVAAMLGVDLELATAIALFDRLTIMALVLTCGPLAGAFLAVRLRKAASH